MERLVAHAIVGVTVGAAVRQLLGGGLGATAVGAALGVIAHEALDAPLAARLREAGL